MYQIISNHLYFYLQPEKSFEYMHTLVQVICIFYYSELLSIRYILVNIKLVVRLKLYAPLEKEDQILHDTVYLFNSSNVHLNNI